MNAVLPKVRTSAFVLAIALIISCALVTIAAGQDRPTTSEDLSALSFDF